MHRLSTLSSISHVGEHSLKKRKVPEDARQTVSEGCSPWRAGGNWRWHAPHHRARRAWCPGLTDTQGVCKAASSNIGPQGYILQETMGWIFPKAHGQELTKRGRNKTITYPCKSKFNRTVAGSQSNDFRSALPSAWPVNCWKIQANRFFCN